MFFNIWFAAVSQEGRLNHLITRPPRPASSACWHFHFHCPIALLFSKVVPPIPYSPWSRHQMILCPREQSTTSRELLAAMNPHHWYAGCASRLCLSSCPLTAVSGQRTSVLQAPDERAPKW